jgi:phenylpropionate dioxygenase-like ring-hydroxylating dioxygenase large terminal subunit
MTSAVSRPADYLDPSKLAQEQGSLFSSCWSFACMRSELAADGDFVRLALAGRDLILRNSHGVLRAFANVCSHRHSRIHQEARGNGPMRCPYHGWVYSHEGLPAGIPFKEQFPEVTADPQAWRLLEFAVDCAGGFVFVRLGTSGPTLAEYLGAHAMAFLNGVTSGAGPMLDEFEREVPANWKIVIENSLEGYHVPIVHSRTIGAADGMAAGYEAVVEDLSSPCHSWMTKEAASAWLAKWGRMSRAIGDWPFRFDHYIHYLVFPNLTITSFLGYSFHVQRFDPVDAATTRVHSRILSARFAGQNEVGRRMIEKMHADSIAFTHRVFDEDLGVCEAVQAGMAQATRPAVLAQDHEARVLHFQKACRAATQA